METKGWNESVCDEYERDGGEFGRLRDASQVVVESDARYEGIEK
jgi:hypothetical protein